MNLEQFMMENAEKLGVTKERMATYVARNNAMFPNQGKCEVIPGQEERLLGLVRDMLILLIKDPAARAQLDALIADAAKRQ